MKGMLIRLVRRFDLNHLKTRGEMLNVFHFGVNRKMNSDLILRRQGVRCIPAIVRFQLDSKQVDIFSPTEGQNNLIGQYPRCEYET